MPQLNASFTGTGPMCLSLWLSMIHHSGQVGSCLCISQCHHNCCCCLYSPLGADILIFSDSGIFCITMCIFTYVEWFCLPEHDFYSWHHVNVISLECKNTDVIALLLFIVCLCMCLSNINNNKVYYFTVTCIHPGHAQGVGYTHDTRCSYWLINLCSIYTYLLTYI